MTKQDKQFVNAIADFRGEPIHNITINDAMNRLKQAMIEEPYYAHAWNRNIAQACYESMDSQPWVSLTEKGISKRHKIANESATTFMKRFFDVETSKDMLLKDEDKQCDKE